jgi:CarD family transcriptional regulator
MASKAVVPKPGAFKVGDRAVHPSHGVGMIIGIELRDIGGTKHEFYILETTDRGRKNKVMVATESAERHGLRKTISPKDAIKVYEVLRTKETAVKAQPWNRRQREYSQMLNSGSPFEVAKVLRDLYRVKGSKELSVGERRLLEQALALVVAELAIAQKSDAAAIEQEIATIFAS